MKSLWQATGYREISLAGHYYSDSQRHNREVVIQLVLNDPLTY
jgi:hypothetical protein